MWWCTQLGNAAKEEKTEEGAKLKGGDPESEMSKRGEWLSPSSVFGFSFSHAITRASKVVGFDMIFELGDDAHRGPFVDNLLGPST